MVKQRRLKYFSVEGDVWCPTKDDFLLAEISKKDLPDIQDAYGKFVGFPTQDKFIQFIKVFFKLKTFKSAEAEFKNIKPIFIGNPLSRKPCEGSDLLLNACLIYLSLLKSKQEIPLFVQQVLIDLFPLDNLSDLKPFLELNFSSSFTLDQQATILKWLQPILEDKDSVVLGPKKSFLSMGYDLKTRRIPNALTVSAFAAGIAFHTITSGFSGLGLSLTGFLAGFLPMALLWLIGGGGGGDVKLMGALGAWVGGPVVLIIFIGSAATTMLWMILTLLGRALFRGQPVASVKSNDVTVDIEESSNVYCPTRFPLQLRLGLGC